MGPTNDDDPWPVVREPLVDMKRREREATQAGSRRRPTTFLSCVVLLMSTAPSCSFLFTQPLRPQSGRTPPDCSINKAPQVVDTVFTLTNVASAIYRAGQPDDGSKDAAITLGLSVAALWASSATYGYAKTSECDDAIREYDSGTSDYRYPLPRTQPRFIPPSPRPAPPPYPQRSPFPGTEPTQAAPAMGDPSTTPPPLNATPPVPSAPPVLQQPDDDDPQSSRRPPTPPVVPPRTY